MGDCKPGFGIAQIVDVDLPVTAFRWGTFAPDPEIPLESGAKDTLEDLIVATEQSLQVIIRDHEPEITWTEKAKAKSQARCSYFPFVYDSEGAPKLPPGPNDEITTCFRAPKVTPSATGIIKSIVVGDFIEDKDGPVYRDVAVARFDNDLITIFPHTDGLGTLDVGKGTAYEGVPGIEQLLVDDYDQDAKADLMLVMPSLGQIRMIFGIGDGSFRRVPYPLAPTALEYIQAEAICIEGIPNFAVSKLLNEDLPPQGTPTPDLAVLNYETGTLWTYLAKSYGDFQLTQVIDIVKDPLQVALEDMNGDKRPDAVALGNSGRIAVSFGALPESPPEFPKTDPRVGVKGTFIGGLNLTTPIPQQDPNRTFYCQEPLEDNGKPDVGTPLDRLTPLKMLAGPFDEDQSMDVVIIPELTTEYTGLPGAGPPVQPVFFYGSKSGVLPASKPLPTSLLVPWTAFCQDNGEDDACANPQVPYDLPKGPVTDVAQGAYEFSGGANNIVMATATSFTLTDQGPPDVIQGTPATVDILLPDEEGGFEQWINSTENPELADPLYPGQWSDFGYMGWSSPSHVVTVHCGATGATVADHVVVGTREAEFSTTKMTLVRGDGNANFNPTQMPAGAVENVELVTDLVAGFAGLPEGQGEDEDPDLFLAAPEGVFVFHGTFVDCVFNAPTTSTSCGATVNKIAVRDIDGDNRAEIVCPLETGEVSILWSIDGQIWDAPDKSLVIEGAGALTAVEIRDLNGDGNLDILVLDVAQDVIHVFLGTASDSPEDKFHDVPFEVPVPPGTNDFQIIDFDQNGCLDLITLSPKAKAASILRNSIPLIGTCVEDPGVSP